MLKKVLIVIGLLVFSVITYTSANVVFTYNEYVAFAEELSEEGKHTDLNRLIYGPILQENHTSEQIFEDGTVLRTYKEVSSFLLEEEKDDVTRQYYHLSEGLQLFFSNVDKDFDFTNVGEAKAVYDNGTSKVYYDGLVSKHVYADSHLADFNVYSFSIDTSEYSTISANKSFNKLEIYDTPEDEDDVEELIYTIDLSSLLTADKVFNSEDSTMWAEYIKRANEYFFEGVENVEEATEILALGEENSEDSNLSISTISQLVTQRSGYKVKTNITIVAIVLLNLVVVYFQFIKGKNLLASLKGTPQVNSNNKPNNNNNNNNNNKQKEVIEVKEETPIVKEVKEETPVVEETKEETPVVEETKDETPVVEETKEETPVVEETKEETPVVEETKEETAVVEKKTTPTKKSTTAKKTPTKKTGTNKPSTKK